jgi:hypothetical protein
MTGRLARMPCPKGATPSVCALNSKDGRSPAPPELFSHSQRKPVASRLPFDREARPFPEGLGRKLKLRASAGNEAFAIEHRRDKTPTEAVE